MSKVYFTMVVYVDDEETLARSIKSIFSVEPGIRKATKLIMVDPFCSDEVRQIADEWKQKLEEDHFVYIPAPEEGVAEGYNRAIPEIRGTYVNFSLASTWFDDGALEAVRYVAEERERPKLISLVPWTINEKDEHVQYQMSPVCTANIYENIRFYKEARKLQLFFHAYFTFMMRFDRMEWRS